MKTIKILGTGCPKCKLLEAVVQEAVQKTGIKAEIIKVTDIEEIMEYNIMSTPGLIIDEKLVSTGKVLDLQEIIDLLQTKSCCDSGKDIGDQGCCSDKESCSIDCGSQKEIKQESKSCGCR